MGGGRSVAGQLSLSTRYQAKTLAEVGETPKPSLTHR